MAIETILSKTINLVRLYRHMCGLSEVPTGFHFWAFLSLMAACVEDRVWIGKLAEEKLTPHLYVMLVGPSRLGKGTAIGQVLRLLRDTEGPIRCYPGRVTAAHLTDFMGKKWTDDNGQLYLPSPKVWLVTDELGNDIGKGGLAQDFIKLMTKLYTTGATDLPYASGTRTHGHVRVDNPCMNWLAGTTDGWMVDTITPDLMQSGWLARTVFMRGGYEDVRYWRPKYPEDRELVREHIVARLLSLQYLEGGFQMTPSAMGRESGWYMNRKRPGDSALWASWKGEQDLVLKLSMLFSLADGGPLVIDGHHLDRAIKVSRSVWPAVGDVLALSAETPVLEIKGRVEEVLAVLGKTTHAELGRRVRRKGVSGGQLRAIMREIAEEGKVEMGQSETGARVYEWRGEGGG